MICTNRRIALPEARRIRTIALIAAGITSLSACEFGAPAPRPVPKLPAPSVAPTGIEPPALAKTGAYVDTLQGVAIPDPYRWLEDTLSGEARAWVAAQETYGAAVLARVVHRDSLAGLYERAIRDAPTLDRVRETPLGLIMARYIGADPSLHIAAKDALAERVLRTVADIAGDGGQSRMRTFVPSPSGRLVAIGATAGGDAGPTVSIVDGGTGRALPDRVPDLLTTTSSTRYEVSWLPDAGDGPAAFFYPRLWPGSASGPPADRLARGRQFLHRIGTPQSADIPVFGYGVSRAVAIAPEDLATRVHTVSGSRWIVGTVFRSRGNGNEHFAARRTAGDSTVPAWQPLLALGDRAGFPQLRGDTAWTLARRDADRGHIRRRVLGDGPLPSGAWETVVPERAGVITAFALQNDALYFTERSAGSIQLNVMPYDTRVVRTVTLPMTGTVRIAPRASTMDGVLVSVESWATPPRWFRVTRSGETVETINIDDGSKSVASPTLVSDRLEAVSHGGARVPVSLVYDKRALDLTRATGGAPLVIEAYGGFGDVLDPTYDPHIAVWTALGGIYAYAHVRGGGDLGDAWHMAATREQKQRSVDDMIAAVETLIARSYTSARRVAIQGISFGAIISGLSAQQRPDLFGAAVYDVGGPDEVRAASLDPSAARNIAELGDVDTPAGIALLRDASPYHVVPAAVALPAMLLHSAKDDYNFGTEMLVAKYVARLQAANSGTRPVIWARTTGGHRWLYSLSPEWAATVASFLLWQTREAQFQPKRK